MSSPVSGSTAFIETRRGLRLGDDALDPVDRAWPCLASTAATLMVPSSSMSILGLASSAVLQLLVFANPLL
jgi:hypothetical protein